MLQHFGKLGAMVTVLYTLVQKTGGFSGRQGRSGRARPRRVVKRPGTFSAPAPILDNTHGCFILLRGLTSAAKSFDFVDEAQTRDEYTGRKWRTAKKRQPT
jgi:hypothetical protein